MLRTATNEESLQAQAAVCKWVILARCDRCTSAAVPHPDVKSSEDFAAVHIHIFVRPRRFVDLDVEPGAGRTNGRLSQFGKSQKTSALDGQEVAIAFKPREQWPKPFRFYSLYR